MYNHVQAQTKNAQGKICGLCSHTSHAKKQLVSFLCILGCPFLSFYISLFRVVRLFVCVLQVWIATGGVFFFFFFSSFFFPFFFLVYWGVFIYLCAFLPVIKRHDFDDTQLISSSLCIIHWFAHSPSSNSAATAAARLAPPALSKYIRPLSSLISVSALLGNECSRDPRLLVLEPSLVPSLDSSQQDEYGARGHGCGAAYYPRSTSLHSSELIRIGAV